MIEWLNRTLLFMLATTIADQPWDWEDNLRQLCYAHNTSVHSSTGHTPFFLMFSCQVRLLVDLAFKFPQTQPVYQVEYTLHLQNTLGDSYKQVREKLGYNLQRQKEVYMFGKFTDLLKTKAMWFGYSIRLCIEDSIRNSTGYGWGLTLL